MPLKLLHATVVTAEAESLKFLHTVFDTTWTTCWRNLNTIVSTVLNVGPTNVLNFEQKSNILNPFSTKALTPF